LWELLEAECWEPSAAGQTGLSASQTRSSYPPVSTEEQLRLAELLAAISLATDLGRGFPPEKALRTCLVAARLAEELGLDEQARSDTFYAALIQPVGCTAFTYEGARLVGTNELKGIPAYVRADTARLREGLRAMREEVRGEPLGRAAHGVFKELTAGRRLLDYVVRADCEAGTRFTERIGLPDSVARVVLQVHERWDGKGLPAALGGEALEVGARVIAVADQAEIFHRLDGRAATREMLRRRTDGWFDPAVVEACERRSDDIFSELEAGSVWDAVLASEAAPPVTLPDWRVDDLAQAVADVVDLKSPFFLGHSRSVAEVAEAAARGLGLGEDEAVAVRRAGLFHDLGRVGVSNVVWDKPGALSAAEWEQVRLHAYHTERVLARSPVLMPLAQLAGMHHERTDGSGYHRGVTAASIPTGARVLAAADVFQALTEPRPHRAARSPKEAAHEVEAMAGAGALDPEGARAVCDAAGVPLRSGRVTAPWPAGLTDREVEVLRLLARGLTKKEIAKALVIAPGTAHTHTVHIYEKLGVSTRAGVALFALEHGLVRP
jgi:HD-GYP domain-containing protein (c-di-GMP phosphodiesterase class II)/DNA-binding CsgD family transcriptional regulator